MFQLATYMQCGSNERLTLPPPAIVKPVHLWTGKQLVSLMLQSNKYAKDMRVTLAKKTKASYRPSKLYDQTETLCPNDG